VKSIRYYLSVLFLVGTVLSVKAQVPELINDPQFRTDAKAAVDSIYNFNFEDIDQKLAPWIKKYPDHPLWTLFDGMKFWWEVLSDLEDTSHDKQFFTMMKKAEYRAGKLLHEQPGHADGLIIKTIVNGYMGRQHANRSEWVTSLNYARHAMNAYEYLLKIQPDLPDLKLAEGLKFYYSEYLPEAYPIVKTVSWALPEGNKEKGLRLLREASREAIFASAEASYFIGNINYNYEENYDVAVQNFEKLQSKYPNNNYYARILVKSYYQQHHFDKALQFIDETLARWKQKQLPYEKIMLEELLTWRGRILEKKGQHAAALECYQKAFENGKELPNTENRSFYVVSGFLAGNILYNQNKFDEAKVYLQQVKKAKAESNYRRRAGNLLSKINS
jgi:tetratricopeptide (TPR) repeat protein